jgi:hypothetical protein
VFFVQYLVARFALREATEEVMAYGTPVGEPAVDDQFSGTSSDASAEYFAQNCAIHRPQLGNREETSTFVSWSMRGVVRLTEARHRTDQSLARCR